MDAITPSSPGADSSFALRYRRCIEQPMLIIAVVMGLCIASGWVMKDFRFDASSDSLLAQGDPELAFFREVSQRFQQQPFLVMTYRPAGEAVFSRGGVEALDALVTDLNAIPGVSKVQSILDAPLLRSPPVPLSALAEGFRTLRSADVDFTAARNELLHSPVFSELLVSKDGSLSAIVLELAASDAAEQARKRYERLQASETVTTADLNAAALESQRAARASREQTARSIKAIRSVRDRYDDNAQMFLGGVPLVASDMVSYIRNDMTLFGAAVLGLIALALYGFFRELRWVFIPLGTSAVTVWLTMGVIAASGQPITAVSSNFVALLTITTVSFTVHLISAYRENAFALRESASCTLAFETMQDKLAPCVYTALTTMVAFGSLMISDIVPIATFGWMMCVGIVISLLVTYSFFASILVLLPNTAVTDAVPRTPRLNEWLAGVSTRRAGTVLLLGMAIAGATVLGVSKVTVGNRLVEYFRSDTEIRRGLDVIDRALGGTVPIDVIVRFDPYQRPSESSESAAEDPFSDPFADPFSDPADEAFADTPDAPLSEAQSYPERFWFTPAKIATIEKLERYMNDRPEIGKTLSVSSFERVARDFNDGEPLSYLALTAVLGSIPQDLRHSLIDPLASPASGEMRISARLRETGPEYQLADLITGIERYAVEALDLPEGGVRITGVGVLFNNMLQLFFLSQFSTLGLVILATLAMFTLLLRSLSLAVIGLLPNVLAASVIMAVMGFAGIPLDIMTITIAAIVIGIGVDDAVHYLHRFKQQLQLGCSVEQAVITSHRTTGQALYFTSFTVVAGFSVLLFSRFVPTAYFGGLAALAMVLALAANLALLPALITIFYSPGRKNHEGGNSAAGAFAVVSGDPGRQ